MCFDRRALFVVRTALHWAAKRNHRQVVEFLLENGANKEIQAHDASTAAVVCMNDNMRALLHTGASNLTMPIVIAPPLPIIPNYLRTMTPLSPTDEHQTTSITLLCRVANDPNETDFVEFDFVKTPTHGSYERLQTILCDELELMTIVKIRRLPHIRVRHDRDVERLKDHHQLEVIVSMTDLATNCKTEDV
jgi:hypothetical protein